MKKYQTSDDVDERLCHIVPKVYVLEVRHEIEDDRPRIAKPQGYSSDVDLMKKAQTSW
jgi:hypothetical protein